MLTVRLRIQEQLSRLLCADNTSLCWRWHYIIHTFQLTLGLTLPSNTPTQRARTKTFNVRKNLWYWTVCSNNTYSRFYQLGFRVDLRNCILILLSQNQNVIDASILKIIKYSGEGRLWNKCVQSYHHFSSSLTVLMIARILSSRCRTQSWVLLFTCLPAPASHLPSTAAAAGLGYMQ